MIDFLTALCSKECKIHLISINTLFCHAGVCLDLILSDHRDPDNASDDVLINLVLNASSVFMTHHRFPNFFVFLLVSCTELVHHQRFQHSVFFFSVLYYGKQCVFLQVLYFNDNILFSENSHTYKQTSLVN